MHWRSRHRAKEKYWAELDLLAASKLIPRFPPAPPAKAYLTVRYFLWAYMDEDNAMHRLKWVLDWMVSIGYLSGDSREHIRYRRMPDQEIDRKDQRLEVTIEPVEFF